MLVGRQHSYIATKSFLDDLCSYCTIPTMCHCSIFVITHVAGSLTLSTVPVSAENVRGFSTPAARVTWSTTVPPECVASVRVEFRTSRRGPAAVTYTTNNTLENEFIQTGLRCTIYYITVIVTGKTSDGIRATLNSRQVQAAVGGKKYCMHEIQLV